MLGAVERGGEGAGEITGMFVSMFNAVDGSRTEGDARIINEAVERTADLDVYTQETKIGRRSPVGAPGRGGGRPILRCATAATYPDARTNWRAPTKNFLRPPVGAPVPRSSGLANRFQ